MAGLVAMCFVDCDKTLAIVVLCIAVGLNGAIYSGYMCSHQDLSPNLAGTLMGITNTVAAIPGFVTPVVTGALTEYVSPCFFTVHYHKVWNLANIEVWMISR